MICKCLEKNPDNRYPDAYVLQLRLQEIPRRSRWPRVWHYEFPDVDGTDETLAADGKHADPEAAGVAMRD